MSVQNLIAQLKQRCAVAITVGTGLTDRPGPESTEAHYLRYMERPELSYLSAAEYLERRRLFVALTQLAPLEHPALATGREIRDRLPTRCLVWHDRLPEGEGPADDGDLDVRERAVATARRQIRDTIQQEFDSRLGWPARPTVRSTERQRETFAAAYAARRDTDPSFLIEPMYVDAAAGTTVSGTGGEGARPMRRLDLLERLSRTDDADAEQIEAVLDSTPLYWECAPARDLSAWRQICEWIDARPGAVASAEQVHALFAQEEQPMPDRARIAAVGLIYFLRGRGRSGWAEEGYHLAEGWRTRLRALESVYAARARADADADCRIGYN